MKGGLAKNRLSPVAAPNLEGHMYKHLRTMLHESPTSRRRTLLPAQTDCGSTPSDVGAGRNCEALYLNFVQIIRKLFENLRMNSVLFE